MKHFVFISSIVLALVLIYKFMINREGEEVGFSEKFKRIALIAVVAIIYNRSLTMLLL